MPFGALHVDFRNMLHGCRFARAACPLRSPLPSFLLWVFYPRIMTLCTDVTLRLAFPV